MQELKRIAYFNNHKGESKFSFGALGLFCKISLIQEVAHLKKRLSISIV